MSVKDQVLQGMQQLPDDIDYRDVSEEIAFLAAIQEAERDIPEGRLVSNEEMKARLAAWERQIEQDSLTGRLDSALERADDHYEAGRCTAL